MKHRKTPQISKELWYKVLTILFFAIASTYMLFPLQQTPVTQEVSFVLTDANAQNHGAASQRDYLFDDSSGAQVYTGQLTTTDTTTPPIQTTTTSSTPTKIPQQLPTLSTGTSSGMYVGTLSPAHLTIQTGTNTSWTTITKPSIPQGNAWCTTPWGEKLQDKEFVLAYEQRNDVSSICNVQRRICNNGVLEGTYMQESCKEDVQYTYTRTQVISQNQEVVNPLVQPQEASNAGATFSTDGKINAAPQQATTTRWTGNTTQISSSGAQQQTPYLKSDCRTPRGSIVKHGQFVKAYKSSLGLIDVPCETEIRLCINGSLKGRFLNKTCTFRNMTYNDYIEGNTDITKPTTQDIVDTLVPPQTQTTSFSITNRIMNLFK